jgi:hypothetical protein
MKHSRGLCEETTQFTRVNEFAKVVVMLLIPYEHEMVVFPALNHAFRYGLNFLSHVNVVGYQGHKTRLQPSQQFIYFSNELGGDFSAPEKVWV